MMTIEEQRIAVAKECGVKLSPIHEYSSWLEMYECNPSLFNDYIRDYPNDLNAMAEAEKVLTPDEQEKYSEILSGYLPTCSDMHHDSTLFPIIHMTSQQRCEAFLRTRGKWKE